MNPNNVAHEDRVEDHVPCLYCGDLTPYTAVKMCQGCYRVMLNLSCFLRTQRGRAYVYKALRRAGATDDSCTG